MEFDPDFEELDLSHELPQDLVRCENPRETIQMRRLEAFALRRRRARESK